jgi:hypothetical protein
MPGRVSRRNYDSRSWGFNQQKLGIKQPIPGSWVQGKTMEHIVMLIFLCVQGKSSGCPMKFSIVFQYIFPSDSTPTELVAVIPDVAYLFTKQL